MVSDHSDIVPDSEEERQGECGTLNKDGVAEFDLRVQEWLEDNASGKHEKFTLHLQAHGMPADGEYDADTEIEREEQEPTSPTPFSPTPFSPTSYSSTPATVHPSLPLSGGLAIEAPAMLASPLTITRAESVARVEEEPVGKPEAVDSSVTEYESYSEVVRAMFLAKRRARRQRRQKRGEAPVGSDEDSAQSTKDALENAAHAERERDRWIDIADRKRSLRFEREKVSPPPPPAISSINTSGDTTLVEAAASQSDATKDDSEGGSTQSGVYDFGLFECESLSEIGRAHV